MEMLPKIPPKRTPKASKMQEAGFTVKIDFFTESQEMALRLLPSTGHHKSNIGRAL